MYKTKSTQVKVKMNNSEIHHKHLRNTAETPLQQIQIIQQKTSEVLQKHQKYCINTSEILKEHIRSTTETSEILQKHLRNTTET